MRETLAIGRVKAPYKMLVVNVKSQIEIEVDSAPGLLGISTMSRRLAVNVEVDVHTMTATARYATSVTGQGRGLLHQPYRPAQPQEASSSDRSAVTVQQRIDETRLLGEKVVLKKDRVRRDVNSLSDLRWIVHPLHQSSTTNGVPR